VRNTIVPLAAGGLGEELLDRLDLLVQALGHAAASFEPRQRDRRNRGADRKRHVTAVEELRQAGEHEAAVDEQEAEQRQHRHHRIPRAHA
jgi:hypothetical protein